MVRVVVEFDVDETNEITAWFVIQRIFATLNLPDKVKFMKIKTPSEGN